jgi:signal transduction histidine kinase
MRAASLFLPTDLSGDAVLTPGAIFAVGGIVLLVIALGLLTRKPRDRRLSVYVLLALALVSGYVGMTVVLEHIVDARANLLGQLLTLGFAAAVALTYAPMRQRLQQVVDALLYRDRYDFGGTLQRFSQELAALQSQDEVASLLLDGLSDTLNLTGSAFLALPEGLDPALLSLIQASDLRVRGRYASARGHADIIAGLTNLDLRRSPLTPDAPLLLEPWPGCAALVLIGAGGAGEGGALLMLGPKRMHSPLWGTDRALLITLAHQAGTALANAALVAGLRTSLAQMQVSTAQLVAARSEQRLLLRRLVDADERQRAALARDLHDDALQEVLYLVRHARLAAELAGDLQRAASECPTGERVGEWAMPPGHAAIVGRVHQELVSLADRSLVAEQRLRALCLGLYPALLTSLGLPAALDELALELASANEVDVRVRWDDRATELAEQLPVEVSLHVYRIVQEALRNAAKHAQATTAELRLSRILLASPETRTPRHPERLYLCATVSDGGKGLALPIDYAALLREGHLGLAGMRERAERIGATLELQPLPGGGTRVRLLVPAEWHAALAAAELG